MSSDDEDIVITNPLKKRKRVEKKIEIDDEFVLKPTNPKNKKNKKKKLKKEGFVVLDYSPGECKRKIKQLTRKGSIKKVAPAEMTPSQDGNPCHVCDLKATPKGYILVHMKTNRTKVNLHHLALRAVGNNPSGAGLQVSHLCHNKRCCNPTHLAWETPKQNNRRKGCSGPQVQVQCPNCSCDFVTTLCKHDPPCVRRSTLV